MKKIINNISIMCSMVLLIVLGACADETGLMGRGEQIVVTATMPDDGPTHQSGMLKSVAVSSDDNSLDLITKWKSGDKIQVFVRQDNKVYKVSEESAIYNISSDGKTCSFNFSLPSSIDGARVYDVIGVTGISAQAVDNEVIASSTMKRMILDSNGEATSPMWFVTAKTNTATNFQAKFQHLGTYEILHVKNSSSGDLTFRHMGFEVSQPWFKYHDNTVLNNTYDPTASFTEPGDTESPPILIKAGATGKILSWYIPSGKLMTNAKLIGLINGKSLTSSNTKSSALPIERGKAYHMYATWDGKQLKFEDDSHGTSDGEIETFTVNGVSFKMVHVEGGTFLMGTDDEYSESYGGDEHQGGPYSDEKPAHRVTLSSFCIGQTEVTQELWQAVMGSNPSYFKGSNLPVESVTWFDCRNFIIKLNLMTGKNFRMPTEAEWEFAARGGNSSKGYLYSGSDNYDEVAWNMWNCGSTKPVATKQANELGLYDMSGNVIEWCQDYYDEDYYNSSPLVNPTGPIGSDGDFRVARGGCWRNFPGRSRVTFRSDRKWTSTSDFTFGLRLVLTESDNEIINTCPDNNHPHIIDLGLPSGTRWACCNVGANAPYFCGDYFAWGETAPKELYLWKSYKWSNGENLDNLILTKYCNDSDFGSVDNKTELELADDAAYVNWGSMWRMPSEEQMDELCSECDWQWISIYGLYGYLVTSRRNGSSLFLPAAGFKWINSHYDDAYGFYWSRTLDNYNPHYSCVLYFNLDYVDWNYYERYYGRSVRAVRSGGNSNGLNVSGGSRSWLLQFPMK